MADIANANTTPAVSTSPGITNTSGVTNPLGNQAKKSDNTGLGTSPWDDDLDVPEEPKDNKPKIIGSLDNSTPSQPSQNAAPAAFVVPKNVEEKVGQKMPAPAPQEKSPDLANAKQEPSNVSPTNPHIQIQKTDPDMTFGTVPELGTTPKKEEIHLADAKETRLSFLKHPIITIGISCLIFLIALVLFTEMGIISLGLEKVYGAVGIEQLWGGLPSKSENALVLSLSKMQEHSDYKVSGQVKMTVDKTIKSPITSPLLSFGQSIYLVAKDQNTTGGQPAIKTTSSDYNYYDTSSDTDSTSSSTNSSNDSSVTSTDNTPSPSDSSDTTSTSQSDITASETKQVQLIGDVSMVAAKGSTQADILLNDSSESREISIINSDNKLLVKSDENIKFDKNSSPSKWLKYDLTGKSDTENGLFSISADSGMSVKGSRVKSEKIDGVRCYQYQLDSVEVGKALLFLGISSDMVQGVSGDVWIGIEDKLIRKVDLKIITPISASTSMIEVVLNFSEYGITNDIAVPAESEIIQAIGYQEFATNDDQRKSDITEILTALKKYKTDNGSYPIANELLKLNTQDNIVYKALNTSYLPDGISVDPKASEGWYYAYKSDGKTCSLSARLENASDSDAQVINSIPLYLKYNKD